MTLKQLQKYNGKNGAKAYVAYKGKIYDVTGSSLWKDGIHKRIHEAGLDLTEAMANAPHAEEVFADFTVIATLKKSSKRKNDWAAWYQKYHPHPMLVHFPIALHLFAAGADLLFFFQQEASYATAVFYTFFIAIIMGVFAMASGFFSWRINYNLAFTYHFIVKISLATITLLLGIVGIAIYINNPDVVYLTSVPSIIYHSIILLTAAAVMVVAYHGGKITWPNKESS